MVESLQTDLPALLQQNSHAKSNSSNTSAVLGAISQGTRTAGPEALTMGPEAARTAMDKLALMVGHRGWWIFVLSVPLGSSIITPSNSGTAGSAPVYLLPGRARKYTTHPHTRLPPIPDAWTLSWPQFNAFTPSQTHTPWLTCWVLGSVCSEEHHRAVAANTNPSNSDTARPRPPAPTPARTYTLSSTTTSRLWY